MGACCGFGWFDYLAIFLGMYVLMPRLYGIYDCIYKSFFLKQHDLHKRYSTGDSWVVVTGCTSGIGEELAHRFAQLNFNIVLISRSEDRLKKVEQDIKTKNSKVKTRIVVADFAKGGE